MYSEEAAEQVVRKSLEGVKVAAKISGEGAVAMGQSDKDIMSILTKRFAEMWDGNPLLCILLILAAAVFGICLYYSTKRNYRRGEEHGSAKWGNPKEINRKYMQQPASDNKLLIQQVRVGLDGRKHRRNLNVLVCGGSGAGKTRFYCKPNIMQANSSFVVLDPNGKEVLGYILQAVH